MNLKTMKKYAEIAVVMGANVQPNQDVEIHSSLENAPFAQCLVEECYKAGARRVKVEWNHTGISRLKLLNESVDTLSEITEELKGRLEDRLKKPCVRILVYDEDPSAYNGIPMEKLIEPRKRTYEFMKPYNDALYNQAQWLIISMPTMVWAKQVYPKMEVEKAYKKLEKNIIQCMRLDQEDPVGAWKAHMANLLDKATKMNEYHFKTLKYTSSNGTDFSVGLHPDHVWMAAEEHYKNGVIGVPNMPTEEVFTFPEKYSANGIVYSSKPLSYNGNLIEDFSITFKEGKAIKCSAKKGKKHLEEMIKMDEGAAYLGEVALVPFSSPINQTGALFLNTLFDENAACHLALGKGLLECLKDSEGQSDEVLKERGYNDSMIHVDFMIGYKDTHIVGIQEDGTEITVFENGMWAI
ncbi:MAG: aminopeptidase [Erysipelotrichaceae bacterium]|nr:aminopeptidase [Erysipelotrichaceae bacterium]